MHGYFLSLKLYDAARVIANPFAYAEHREKMVQEKLDKMADTRIRTRKEANVKVNKALADKVLRDEEKARKRAEKKRLRAAEQDSQDTHQSANDHEAESRPNLLNDPRFAQLFEDPDFAVDEQSREYAMMNPSSVSQRESKSKTKTAVEEEDEESDPVSSDSSKSSDNEDEDQDNTDSDSSDAGGEYANP